MKVQWRYDWNAGNNSSSDSTSVAEIKKDIAFMVARGCSTRDLKSKIKKLNSLNDGML